MANGVKNALDRIGATQSFTSFINKAAEKSPSLVTPRSEGGGYGGPASYEKIWEEGNKPFIKMYGRGELAKEGQSRYGGTAFSADRAFFTHAENYPEEPDTLHVGETGISDFMAEMGHAIDYNVSQDERKELRSKGNFEWALHGEGVYGKKVEQLWDKDQSGQIVPSEVNFMSSVSGGEGQLTELDPGLYYPKGPKKRSILSFIGHSLWPGTKHEKYEEGVTPQSDVPTEFHAHNVTESRLWKGLQEGKYE